MYYASMYYDFHVSGVSVPTTIPMKEQSDQGEWARGSVTVRTQVSERYLMRHGHHEGKSKCLKYAMAFMYAGILLSHAN